MNSTLLILLAAGAAAWYFYRQSSSSTDAPAGTVATSGGTTPTAGTVVYTGLPGTLILPTATTTPSGSAPPLVFLPGMTTSQGYAAAASSSQTLGDIYQAMRNYTADIGQDFTPLQWNSIVEAVSTVVPPNPADVWGTTPTRQMRIEEYWANMAPWLAAHRGMSGGRSSPSIRKLVQTQGGWTA